MPERGMAFQFTPKERERREATLRRALQSRKARKLTYQETATESGYSVSTLKRWAKLLGLDDHPVNK